jgi:hypothetical protein
MPWMLTSQVVPMYTSPQQMLVQIPSHLLYQQQHRPQSPAEYQPAMLTSTMSDMGSQMGQHVGADGVHAGGQPNQQQMHHPMSPGVPVQQVTVAVLQQKPFFPQSLPAQPGNPFASAMTVGSGLQEAGRSTSFAT